MKIKILRGCGANGQSLEAGRVYSVPDEVSTENANILLLMGLVEKIQAETVEAGTSQEIQKEVEIAQTQKKEMVQAEEEIKKPRRRGRPRRRK